ncbi:MAG: LD-carboxypeptidase [Bacteroidota bacterium]|nr:LD-carboxypeptidase [Bacteroidota bacterium]
MIPEFLKPSDQLRIISPSGTIYPEYIDGAKRVLTDWGLQVSEGKYARTEYGRFAGTREERIADLQEALDDPTVQAILCSRGGYGVAQIIDKIDFSRFEKSPKWLIGFSDITILHNAITNLGIASIHGIMAKYLTEFPADSEPSVRLKKMLFGELPAYSLSAQELNKTGSSTGKLTGGNLSVLMGLRGSQYDLKYENSILFVEDIAEKPYHIDRMMQNLRISGALGQLSGLVVGQFSDCDEDPLMMQTIQEIILNAVDGYDYPVCFNFPAGHVDYNLPILLGEKANLSVTKERTELSY